MWAWTGNKSQITSLVLVTCITRKQFGYKVVGY